METEPAWPAGAQQQGEGLLPPPQRCPHGGATGTGMVAWGHRGNGETEAGAAQEGGERHRGGEEGGAPNPAPTFWGRRISEAVASSASPSSPSTAAPGGFGVTSPPVPVRHGDFLTGGGFPPKKSPVPSPVGTRLAPEGVNLLLGEAFYFFIPPPLPWQ